VTKRLRFAEAVEQETLKKYAEKWAAARASIADPKQCPQYGGLQLAPQLGLIPIRKDPQSGLWEFAHLQTTAEGVDPIPAVRADGRYDLQESTGLIFVLIPGGTFQMGARLPTDEEEEESSDGGVPLPPNVDRQAAEQEGPVHTVALSHFFISKFEMTQGQWSRIAGRNPARFRPGAGAMTDERPVTLLHPVEMISWDDCFGDRGRLTRVELDAPTEAQWEYACRANTTTPWWCGMENRCLQTTANVADAFMRINGGPTDKAYEVWNDGYSLHSCVGSLAPNQFGLYDMSGNVWEWCRDGFMGYPLATPRVGDGLRLPHAGYHISSHILRGGSFFYSAREARSAARNGGVPTLRDFNLGVRPIFQPTQR
jgi:formylglycine-generating enzyme required for sulfatase activity